MKRLLLQAVALAGVACSSRTETVEAVLPPPAPAAPAAEVIVVPDNLKVATDEATIARGKELFATKGCVGCHKVGGGRLVGPDLKGVTARRSPEWMAKMLLRPDLMVKQDAAAKKLLAEYLVPMPNQQVNPDTELPALMSYLKSVEQ